MMSPTGLANSSDQTLNHFGQALDGLTEAVFFYDSAFRVVWANAAYAELAGRDPAVIRGDPYWESFPLGNGPDAHAKRALELGSRERGTLTLADGRVFNALCFPVSDGGSEQELAVQILEEWAAEGDDLTVQAPEEERLSYILANTPEGILVVNPEGAILFANPVAGEILGYPTDALEGQQLGIPAVGHGSTELEIPASHGEGVRTLELSSREAEWKGQPARIVSLHDVTQRKRREQEHRQAAKVFENTVEGIIIADPDQQIQAVNEAFTRITGYTQEEVAGHTPRILSSGMQGREFYQAMWSSLRNDGVWEGEIWNRRKNGEAYPEWLTISEVRDAQGYLTNYVAVFSDITKARKTEEELEFLTYHDPLTRLPNRALFRERVDHALTSLERRGRHLAVAIIDLEGFGALNDTLGPDAGDRLLHHVASVIASELREGDTVARPGGDEFWVLLEDLAHGEDAQRVVSHLLSTLHEPVDLRTQTFRPTASAGVALAPDDATDIDALLTRAATALHQAQQAGGSGIHFYQAAFGEQAGKRFQLEEALKVALEQDQLELWYQPQVDLVTGQVVGAEALIRWRHPEWGLISPGTFIPLAEETGLIYPLGNWVLARAVTQAAEWRKQGVCLNHVGINISPAQLQGTDLNRQVKTELARSGLAPECLELEVTEEGFLGDLAGAQETLGALKQQGVRLAIDDFGTGYSSLAYLKALDVDVLKIDKAFVDGLPDDPNDSAIVHAIQAVGKSLGLELLAEGVETAEQAGWLADQGICVGQGFLHARPMPAAELQAWMGR